MKLYQVFDRDNQIASERWFANQKEAIGYRKELKGKKLNAELVVQDYPSHITRAAIAWMLNTWPRKSITDPVVVVPEGDSIALGQDKAA